MAFSAEQTENIAAYGGYGGGYGSGAFGGLFAMIILIVVVLWLLFRDGHKGDYHGGQYPMYGYGNGCGPCVQPTYKDESNWEQEAHLRSKLCEVDRDIWKTDQDVWKTSCETQNVERCEAEKTRALIEKNYVQDLRDKLAAVEMEKQTLKNEMFTEKKFDQMMAAIGVVKGDIDKQFCKTDAEIAHLSCELPKRPPVFARTDTVCLEQIPDRRRFEEFPRRRHFNDECCA